jgi:hypothetical protein
MKKNLIIGKNSSIVREIYGYLTNFECISHYDIKSTNLKQYDYIFLFSWSKTSLEDNKKLILLIPAKKLIFISTFAVHSLSQRSQWNRYPKDKKICEDLVLQQNSKVLRIGVVSNNIVLNSFTFIPFTNIKKLADLLNEWNSSMPKVTNFFDIKEGQIKGIKRIFGILFYTIAKQLPSKFVFQAPFEVFAKALNIKSYGYSADSSKSIFDSIMIGYGVLGANFLSHTLPKVKVIVSPYSNMLLNKDGFRNTLVGYDVIGLARFWHGVSIYQKGNKFFKNVPIIVKRNRPPSSSIKAHCNSIKFFNNFFEIEVTRNDISHQMFSRNIILAAGPFENIKLIQAIIEKKIDIKLSDHEVGIVGNLSSDSACKSNLIRKLGPFILRKEILSFNDKVHPFILEARPDSAKKIDNLYHSGFLGIIFKIIKNFSFKRLNEAFFNKFGIAFKTENIQILVQILNKSCIHIKNSSFKRKRLTNNDFNSIKKNILILLPEINFVHKVYTIDAHHIMGGREIFKNILIDELIKNKRLKILGIPNIHDEDQFHQTERLKNYSLL